MPRSEQSSEAGRGEDYNAIVSLALTPSELTRALKSAYLKPVDLDERMRSLAGVAQGNPKAVRTYRILEARRPAAFHTVRALDSLAWVAAHEGGEHDAR